MLCKSRKYANRWKASHWDVTNQVTEISLDLTDVDIFSQLSDIGLLFQTDSVLKTVTFQDACKYIFIVQDSLFKLWSGVLVVGLLKSTPNNQTNQSTLNSYMSLRIIPVSLGMTEEIFWLSSAWSRWGKRQGRRSREAEYSNAARTNRQSRLY